MGRYSSRRPSSLSEGHAVIGRFRPHCSSQAHIDPPLVLMKTSCSRNEDMRRLVVHTARFLEELYTTYNRPEFIHPDPLEFLHRYPDIADREIVGIIASSLAYGRVAQILKSISCILEKMGPSPRQFLEDVSRETLKALFPGFKHRFTTGIELVDFLMAIRDVIQTTWIPLSMLYDAV